jgi:glycosyltransferase involved in cell wall biosynthesis
VAAEIMASGLALVSTGVGGAKELIEPGKNGLLYEAGNAASLVEALQKFLANPSLLQQLASSGEKRVRESFSVDISAKQLEELSVSSPMFVL